MSEPVTTFGGATKLPLPVERILMSESAMSCTEVIVLGWKEDGSLHFAMSDPGLDRALMLLAIAQQQVVNEANSTASPF